MHYTLIPEEKHAKAYGRNLRISAKHAAFLCRVIRKKPLARAKRLLEDLSAQRRSLDGKYYMKTAKEMLMLLNSCEKNADAMGLDTGHLMVHASAHLGTHLRRRRRKQGFGFRLKSANVEIILKEKVPHDVVSKADLKKQPEEKVPKPKVVEEMKEQSERIREQAEELEKQVEKIAGKDIPTHADERKAKKTMNNIVRKNPLREEIKEEKKINDK